MPCILTDSGGFHVSTTLHFSKHSSSFNFDCSMSSMSSSMVQFNPLFPLVSIFIMQWVKQTIICQLTSKLTFMFPMFTSTSLSSTQESSTMPHTSLKFFYSTENVLKFEKKVLWRRKEDLFSAVKIFILRIFLFSEYFSFVASGPGVRC